VRSGIRLRKVVPSISWLLFKGFFWRMREKYVIRDFHPLVFFYMLGFLMTVLGLGLGIAEVVLRILGNQITAATVVLVAAPTRIGLAVHALRDVVRRGVEQGTAVTQAATAARRSPATCDSLSSAREGPKIDGAFSTARADGKPIT
jgi:hypothetical protein